MIRIYKGINSFYELSDFESVYRFLNNYRGKHLSICLNNDVTNEVVRELTIRSLRINSFCVYRGYDLGNEYSQHTCIFKFWMRSLPYPTDPNYFCLTKISGYSGGITYVGNFNNLKFLLDFEIQKVFDYRDEYILHFNNFKLYLKKEDRKYLTLFQRLLISHPLLVKNLNKTKLSTNLVKEFFRYIE